MKKLKTMVIVLAITMGGLQFQGCGSNTDPELQNIVETAIAAGDFETLAAALEAAGLIETLEGPGPFTVFAPTDEAFAALPEGTVEALLMDIPALTEILTYHVVPGDLSSTDVINADFLTTVQGEDLIVTVVDGSVFVNDIEIITPDVEATNGRIHVISGVLLPPEE